ncbi:MAG: type II toxin-antitoxin system HicB family antitoxin [FCB group bacterium]|nr:type II toxin-antitoxin system HicB family antitoxin [FCB group bacterium]
MKIMKYTAIFEPADEGGYVVHVPVLDGLTTEGDTLEEARAMAEDAIKAYVETCKELGYPIPLENEEYTTHVEKLSVGV